MTIVCSRCDGNHMRSECPTTGFQKTAGDYDRLLTTWAECRELLTRERETNFALRRVLESIANNTCCEGCQEAARVAKAALDPNEDPSGQRREPMSPHPSDDEPPFSGPDPRGPFLTQWERREDYEREKRGERPF